MDRAGIASAVRSGATCRVGSGDGIGARRAFGAAPGWVARAGVDVRARRTVVRLRVDFAVARLRVDFAVVRAVVFLVPTALFVFRFALRLFVFVPEPRLVERTDPVLLFRDAAAFKLLPLVLECWPRPSSRTPRIFPGPPLQLRILAERVTRDPTVFIGPIHNPGLVVYTPFK